MWDTIKRTKRPGHGNWTLLLCEELSLHELITHKFINTSFPLINLFSHLFSSVWTHRYLFYTLSYNPILLSLITQSVLALAIGSSFGWLLCVFGITLSMLYGLCCCYLFVSVWFGFFGSVMLTAHPLIHWDCKMVDALIPSFFFISWKTSLKRNVLIF